RPAGCAEQVPDQGRGIVACRRQQRAFGPEDQCVDATVVPRQSLTDLTARHFEQQQLTRRRSPDQGAAILRKHQATKPPRRCLKLLQLFPAHHVVYRDRSVELPTGDPLAVRCKGNRATVGHVSCGELAKLDARCDVPDVYFIVRPRGDRVAIGREERLTGGSSPGTYLLAGPRIPKEERTVCGERIVRTGAGKHLAIRRKRQGR